MPLPPSLDGPKAKVARACEHIATLQVEIARFLRNDPYRAIRDQNPQNGTQVWRLKVDHPVPMHLGIIESLNQGNFPPQMPYYSGVRMTYHYFVDFHTAIIEKMADTFNPGLLVYLNSFFAGLFALAVYVLANHVTRSTKASCFAVITGFLAEFSATSGFSRLSYPTTGAGFPTFSCKIMFRSGKGFSR